MKAIRQFAVIAAIITLFMLTSAYADSEKHAKYEIDFTYSESTSELIGEVHLTTKDVPLVAGSFGFFYDPSIKDDVEFTLNENWFTYDGRADHSMEDGTNYTAFSWLSKRSDGITPAEGRVLMGKIVVKNVRERTNEDGTPTLVGWHNQTLRKLDWLDDTNIAQTPFFTDETNGLCYNKEIWRKLGEDPYQDALSADSQPYVDYNLDDAADAEKGETGYFQGLISFIDQESGVNYEQWVDIDYTIDFNPYILPDPPEMKEITGVFWSYNKNNEPVIKLYNVSDGSEYTDDEFIVEYTHEYFADGRVYTTYTAKGVKAGTYNLTVSKNSHLPYTSKNVIIKESDAGTMRNLGDSLSYLYCGDVNGDGKIKLNDLSELMLKVNTHAKADARYDLNGDGRLTFHDLNILRTYYNKTYGEVG